MTSVVKERDKLESSESLSALALQLEGQSAENILRWASERYGARLPLQLVLVQRVVYSLT